jgi:hypothetical protein
MQDHDDNDTITQDHDPLNQSSASTQTSTHNTQPATTSTSKKTSGRWTDNEIKLLLDYVESNCTLTTARGLTLKKSEFNKAHATVKSKDATQCHYKWAQVRILIINAMLSSLTIGAIVMYDIQSNFTVGQEVRWRLAR